MVIELIRLFERRSEEAFIVVNGIGRFDRFRSDIFVVGYGVMWVYVFIVQNEWILLRSTRERFGLGRFLKNRLRLDSFAKSWLLIGILSNLRLFELFSVRQSHNRSGIHPAYHLHIQVRPGSGRIVRNYAVFF